jgi:predicted transposase YbfD/YdcC
MSKSIIDYFSIIEDPRKGRNVQHKLEDIIVLSIMACIAGAEGWEEIEEFGISKQAFFEDILELPHGIPSHDTTRRVFMLLDPMAFERCFESWTSSLQRKKKGVIAFDGKTLRGSHDRIKGKQPLHMVSAWSSSNHVVLGQLAVDGKTNEITAIPQLMDLLDLSKTVVTIDAMGTQTAIAAKIRDKKADYVLALKGNQGYLKELAESGFKTRKADLSHETIEKDHGRIETRKCYVINQIDWMDEEKERWKDIGSIIKIDSTRQINDQTTEETRYYISSLNDNITLISDSIREHWGIENKVHWSLDVTFREDESRKRAGKSATNFAVVRRIALNLLKLENTSKASMKRKRLKAGWDEPYLRKVLRI